MGLFKDFKEDFSQAVDSLLPGEDMAASETTDDLVVDTLDETVDVASELSKLDGLLEHVEEVPSHEEVPSLESELAPAQEAPVASKTTVTPQPIIKETKKMEPISVTGVNPQAVADETSVITASTTLTGDLQSSGSFEIQGTINGNITCNGKLTVTGTINGNSNSAEFFADVAKIEGEVVSTGTVKVGTGSVIIGNITASSAVIAGAVKGDIDVQGPVVVDTSAVIMGNIKSRSVQINNGAVIEGFCSQCYADIDVQGLFENR